MVIDLFFRNQVGTNFLEPFFDAESEYVSYFGLRWFFGPGTGRFMEASLFDTKFHSIDRKFIITLNLMNLGKYFWWLYPNIWWWRVEWRHFQTFLNFRVAIFTQQGCQIAGFPRISCILVVFILFSTWKNNCGGYTHTFDDGELNTLFFKLVWIAGLPYLHNRFARLLFSPSFHVFWCNFGSNLLGRMILVAIQTNFKTVIQMTAFSNLSRLTWILLTGSCL